MINVLSLNDAHLGNTALELHASLKQWRKSEEKNSSGRKYTTLHQSIPIAAQQIFIMALSSLNDVDLIVLGDHCVPQLNDTKVINTFCSQNPFYQLSHISGGKKTSHFRSYFVSYSTEYIDSSIYNAIDFVFELLADSNTRAIDSLYESMWFQPTNSICDTTEQCGYKMCYTVSPSFVLFWWVFLVLPDAHIAACSFGHNADTYTSSSNKHLKLSSKHPYASQDPQMYLRTSRQDQKGFHLPMFQSSIFIFHTSLSHFLVPYITP